MRGLGNARRFCCRLIRITYVPSSVGRGRQGAVRHYELAALLALRMEISGLIDQHGWATI